MMPGIYQKCATTTWVNHAPDALCRQAVSNSAFITHNQGKVAIRPGSVGLPGCYSANGWRYGVGLPCRHFQFTTTINGKLHYTAGYATAFLLNF